MINSEGARSSGDAFAGARVSVVVATRNPGRTLSVSLDSICGQSRWDGDLVVMDGGSSDGTTQVLERYADSIAYWESEPDRGVYHAWNKALDHVGGEWICFLGADDRFAAPDVLERITPVLQAAAGRYRVAYAPLHVVSRSGEVMAAVGQPWETIREAFRERMTLPNPATFYHRSLFERHGRFDERFRITGDYEFLLRELLDHDALFIPADVAVLMEEGGLSSDPKQRARRLREIATARHMHGLTRVPPWASPPVVKASARAALERVAGEQGADRVRSWYRALTRQAPD